MGRTLADCVFMLCLQKGMAGSATPGVFVRVANKGLAGGRICKSGKERTYGREFLRIGATAGKRREGLKVGRCRGGRERPEEIIAYATEAHTLI